MQQEKTMDGNAGKPLWEERLQGGAHWSGLLRRGRRLRLTDLEGGANVSALFYNAQQPLERYNMADTLKAQHTARLTRGNVCYSDMGRVLCSIVADTVGWHDTICGVSNAADVERRFGTTRYQEQRNARFRNGMDSLLVELARHGLGLRDLVANVNFFSKVVAAEDGGLQFVAGNSGAGDYVELRFEMPALVVLATAPHALDPRSRYAPRPVLLSAWPAPPPAPDDECRVSCAENRRGFINTERLFA
jgi:urea carboxylase-associated protein 2